MLVTIFVFTFSFLILHICIVKLSFCFMHTARTKKKKQRADYAAPCQFILSVYFTIIYFTAFLASITG